MVSDVRLAGLREGLTGFAPVFISPISSRWPPSLPCPRPGPADADEDRRGPRGLRLPPGQEGNRTRKETTAPPSQACQPQLLHTRARPRASLEAGGHALGCWAVTEAVGATAHPHLPEERGPTRGSRHDRRGSRAAKRSAKRAVVCHRRRTVTLSRKRNVPLGRVHFVSLFHRTHPSGPEAWAGCASPSPQTRVAALDHVPHT